MNDWTAKITMVQQSGDGSLDVTITYASASRNFVQPKVLHIQNAADIGDINAFIAAQAQAQVAIYQAQAAALEALQAQLNQQISLT